MSVRLMIRLLIASAGCVLAGCSGTPPMVPVSGTVLLDGKPVEQCQVCYFPEDPDSNPLVTGYGMATTDASGKYEITNALGESGIFPGRYKITLCLYVDKNGKLLPVTAKPSEVPGGTKNVMPKAFESPRSSPETVEVPRGGTTKNFDIKSR